MLTSTLPLPHVSTTVPGFIPLSEEEKDKWACQISLLSWPEETHLARALFRRGIDETRHCSFSEGFIDPPTYKGFLQSSFNGTSSEGQCSDATIKQPLYSPLQGKNTVRLLELKPGPLGSVIQCSFLYLDLSSQTLPAYEAISYAWGDTSDTLEVSCNGHMVHITRSLYTVFERIRCFDRVRCVWADALCVNQRDSQELGQQVSIMREIYQSAHCTLVWLGNDLQEKAHEAFALCCTIVENWRLPPDKPIVDGFAEYSNMISTATEGELDPFPPVSAEVWDSLIVMFNLPWFRRVWVIQEVTVATSVVLLWGNAHISWPLIGLTSAWILTKGYNMMRKKPIPFAYNAFLMYTLPVCGNSAFKELNFSNILGSTRGRFLASDPRDRIFSLLGIPTRGIDTGKALFIYPDYERSLVSIYVEIAIKILRQDRHLRLLSGVQHGATIDMEYPSWVPRWHESAYESFGFRDENSSYANAGKLFEPSANDTFGDDPSPTLAVNGLFYDVVRTISPIMKEGELDPRALGVDLHIAFTYILNELSSREKQYRTTWNAGDGKFVLYRDDKPFTITGNITLSPGKYRQRDNEAPSPPQGYLGESLLYWRERSMWHDSQDAFQSDDADLVDWYHRRTRDPEDSERCLGSLYAFYERRIFLTDDGVAGLGPQAMQPGDIVCVLFGATVPFVLRSCWDEEKKEAYQLLVGECFMPKIMGGETVKTAEKCQCDKHYAKFVLR